MALTAECTHSLTLIDKDWGIEISHDNILVAFNKFSTKVEELNFNCYIKCSESEKQGYKSYCYIEIVTKDQGIYAFHYSKELLHYAFVDYVLIQKKLKSFMVNQTSQ